MSSNIIRISSLDFTIKFLDCDQKYNITHIIQDDNILISFPPTDVLKSDRSIRCNSTSSFTRVYGCVAHCTNLGFGVDGEVVLNMTHSNGTSEICSINYVIGNMRDLHCVYNR